MSARRSLRRSWIWLQAEGADRGEAMRYQLTLTNEEVGFIIHRRGKGPASNMIREALSIRLSNEDFQNLPFKTVWGSHDGLVLPWFNAPPKIGDAEFGGCEMHDLTWYEDQLDKAAFQIKIFRPVAWTPDKGEAAGEYWIQEINNTPYGVLFFPRIILRCVFGEHFEWAHNLREHFCTQGVMEAWRDGAHEDIYENNLPTPLHTEKRLVKAFGVQTLEDVTTEYLFKIKGPSMVGWRRFQKDGG